MAVRVVTKSDFAAISNVTPGRVSQWISEGKIKPSALIGTGRSAKIDVELAQSHLRGSLDPGQMIINGAATNRGRGRSNVPPPLPPHLACVADYENPVDAGAVMLGMLLAVRIGALMANMAIAAGADIRVAFTLKDLATVSFNSAFEDACSDMGIDIRRLRYRPDLFDDLDWSACARDVGEPVDLKAWAAWSTERKRLLKSQNR